MTAICPHKKPKCRRFDVAAVHLFNALKIKDYDFAGRNGLLGECLINIFHAVPGKS